MCGILIDLLQVIQSLKQKVEKLEADVLASRCQQQTQSSPTLRNTLRHVIGAGYSGSDREVTIRFLLSKSYHGFDGAKVYTIKSFSRTMVIVGKV